MLCGDLAVKQAPMFYGLSLDPFSSLDAVVLTAFVAMKWQSDPLIVVIGIVGIALMFLFVRVFLPRSTVSESNHDYH